MAEGPLPMTATSVSAGGVGERRGEPLRLYSSSAPRNSSLRFILENLFNDCLDSFRGSAALFNEGIFCLFVLLVYVLSFYSQWRI